MEAVAVWGPLGAWAGRGAVLYASEDCYLAVAYGNSDGRGYFDAYFGVVPLTPVLFVQSIPLTWVRCGLVCLGLRKVSGFAGFVWVVSAKYSFCYGYWWCTFLLG